MNVARALAGAGIDPSEARLLLEHATGLGRVALIAHPEAELGEAQAERFRVLAQRRLAGEPVAYLLGEREFYGLPLGVTPEVLIPRPETELLVDFALEKLPRGGSMLDLGTGSGAIALALKHERPDARVVAVDRSEGALAVARQNGVRHGLDVGFLCGSWYGPLDDSRFDLIVSNPPYVAEGDRHLAEGDLRFEPRAALVGGSDGLDPIREIVAAAPGHLRRGGWLAIEHGRGQDAEVRALFSSAGFGAVASRPDLAGIARVVVGTYNLD